MKKLTEEEPEIRIPIDAEISGQTVIMPEYLARLRDLVARLRASDRSAIIVVDGRLGEIQIFNATPAGRLKIR